MSRTTRAGGAVLALALMSSVPAMAQIPGMPLFTNPRMSTGFRVHADLGQNTKSDPNGSLRVVQGGVNFVLGPVGIEANLGTTLQSLNTTNSCTSSPTPACLKNHYTASALGAIKVYGGGVRNVSVALFGGGSMDIDSAQFVSGGGAPKLITIPVGASIGLRVPLGGLASLNLWGAPRYVMSSYTGCSGTCPTSPKGYFGWAIGADLPIFRILSIRAAYDSHSVTPPAGGPSTTVNVIGVGASIGLGGMR